MRMHFPVERYDACTRQHPHFCCRVCGAVSDLELKYDPSLDEEAAQSSEQEVDWHDLVFYGHLQNLPCAEAVLSVNVKYTKERR